jgi:hypothetical protein
VPSVTVTKSDSFMLHVAVIMFFFTTAVTV